MSLLATFKARNAAGRQSKGDTEGALALYREAVDNGLKDPRYLLGYIVLLLRTGSFPQARELMVKMQNSPLLTADQKVILFANYAVCVYKMGDLEKGIQVLEGQHKKNPCGLIYETLGYLYVEAGDLDKAVAFNQEAIAYDDEDAICVDNLAQTYYRLAGDKETAKTYFDKAHALKPGQMDTLYFLALYDLEKGDRDAARAKLEQVLDGSFSPLNYVTKEKVQALLDA